MPLLDMRNAILNSVDALNQAKCREEREEEEKRNTVRHSPRIETKEKELIISMEKTI